MSSIQSREFRRLFARLRLHPTSFRHYSRPPQTPDIREETQTIHPPVQQRRVPASSYRRPRPTPLVSSHTALTPTHVRLFPSCHPVHAMSFRAGVKSSSGSLENFLPRSPTTPHTRHAYHTRPRALLVVSKISGHLDFYSTEKEITPPIEQSCKKTTRFNQTRISSYHD